MEAISYRDYGEWREGGSGWVKKGEVAEGARRKQETVGRKFQGSEETVTIDADRGKRWCLWIQKHSILMTAVSLNWWQKEEGWNA